MGDCGLRIADWVRSANSVRRRNHGGTEDTEALLVGGTQGGWVRSAKWESDGTDARGRMGRDRGRGWTRMVGLFGNPCGNCEWTRMNAGSGLAQQERCSHGWGTDE